MDSDLLADRIFTDTMINNADGSRYETETTTARNGAILGTVWTTTSIDGKTETLVKTRMVTDLVISRQSVPL